MKKLTLFIIVLLFSSSILYAQKENKDIKNIRKMFKEINRKANSSYLNYARFQMTDNSQSTEGGIITAFVSKKKFKKITAQYLGEMGKYNVDFYLKDNKLFFVYTVRTYYNAPIYLSKSEAKKNGVEAFDPKKSTKEENRFYFKDNKLIRWINKDKQKVNVNTKESLSKSKELLKEVERIINMIKKEI